MTLYSFTREEEIAEIELASTGATARTPSSIVIDQPGWFQITTPGANAHWLNGVAHAVLTPAEAPRRVAEVCKFYRDQNLTFRWKVGPADSPKNLDQLLEKEGLELAEEVAGMVAGTDNWPRKLPEGVEVLALTPDLLADYVNTACAIWKNSEEEEKLLHAEIERVLFGPAETRDPTVMYFLGLYRGKPAGTAFLKRFKRSGYLIAGGVRKEFRGKGVYRALVTHRVNVLSDLGIPMATIQAIKRTSAPLLRHMGFRHVCDLKLYRWTAP